MIKNNLDLRTVSKDIQERLSKVVEKKKDQYIKKTHSLIKNIR